MIVSLVLSLIIAIEIVVLTDIILTLRDIHYRVRLYFPSVVIITVVLFFFFSTFNPQLTVVSLIPIVIIFTLKKIWIYISTRSKNFAIVDNGKAALFADKKVMLIVPHQDDEINVLGGVIDEYIKYGSEIYIVYAITNGKLEKERWIEALTLLTHIGVPEDHVIFLGFEGLQWWRKSKDILTESIQEHKVYQEGKLFTRENVVSSLCEIITSTTPDTIFASDYDNHCDHHLVSVLFDEAMGKVLKSNLTYHPIVIKAYAYRTAWESYPDFFQENIGATYYKKDKFDTYHWEERLRFPVSAHMFNRSLLKSEIFHQYSFFQSQGAIMRAITFNTDKIGWQRRTDNIFLHADIKVTSGDGSKLNDFKVIDKQEFSKLELLPITGAWIPTQEDSRKEAVITLQNPSYIEYLIIHQNIVGHIHKIGIKINNGEISEYLLDRQNLPTRILINQSAIISISITVILTDGDNAGITEIEAYSTPQQYSFDYIKVTNLTGDFIYDYWINKSGKDTLRLYASGLAIQRYKATVSNINCSVSLNDNNLLVKCPKGQTTLLSVSSTDGKYSDTIIISNPSPFDRFKNRMMQWIEHLYYGIFIGDYHRKATTISMVAMVRKKMTK